MWKVGRHNCSHMEELVRLRVEVRIIWGKRIKWGRPEAAGRGRDERSGDGRIDNRGHVGQTRTTTSGVLILVPVLLRVGISLTEGYCRSNK